MLWQYVNILHHANKACTSLHFTTTTTTTTTTFTTAITTTTATFQQFLSTNA